MENIPCIFNVIDNGCINHLKKGIINIEIHKKWNCKNGKARTEINYVSQNAIPFSILHQIYKDN